MASFKDKLGREWVLELTKGDIRRVQSKSGIPLGELLGNMDRLASELLQHPDRFFEVVWVLLESQAEKLGLNRESLEDGWSGQAEEDAGVAFVDALVDFSPARKAKDKLKEAFRAMEATAVKAYGQKIDTLLQTEAASLERRILDS